MAQEETNKSPISEAEEEVVEENIESLKRL